MKNYKKRSTDLYQTAYRICKRLGYYSKYGQHAFGDQTVTDSSTSSSVYKFIVGKQGTLCEVGLHYSSREGLQEFSVFQVLNRHRSQNMAYVEYKSLCHWSSRGAYKDGEVFRIVEGRECGFTSTANKAPLSTPGFKKRFIYFENYLNMLMLSVYHPSCVLVVDMINAMFSGSPLEKERGVSVLREDDPVIGNIATLCDVFPGDMYLTTVNDEEGLGAIKRRNSYEFNGFSGYSGGKDTQVIQRLQRFLPTGTLIPKTGFGLNSEDVYKYNFHCRDVVIVGGFIDICISAICGQLFSTFANITVIEDCIADPNKEAARIAIARLKNIYKCRIISLAEYLKELEY